MNDADNAFENKNKVDNCWHMKKHTCIFAQKSSLKVEFIERCWVDQRLFRFYLSLASAFSPAFSSAVQVNERLNKLFTATTWTGEKLNKHIFISVLYYLSENKDNKIKKEKQMVPQVSLEVDLHVQKRNSTPLQSIPYHPY